MQVHFQECLSPGYPERKEEVPPKYWNMARAQFVIDLMFFISLLFLEWPSLSLFYSAFFVLCFCMSLNKISVGDLAPPVSKKNGP
jgi:hypothetical protein